MVTAAAPVLAKMYRVDKRVFTDGDVNVAKVTIPTPLSTISLVMVQFFSSSDNVAAYNSAVTVVGGDITITRSGTALYSAGVKMSVIAFGT